MDYTYCHFVLFVVQAEKINAAFLFVWYLPREAAWPMSVQEKASIVRNSAIIPLSICTASISNLRLSWMALGDMSLRYQLEGLRWAALQKRLFVQPSGLAPTYIASSFFFFCEATQKLLFPLTSMPSPCQFSLFLFEKTTFFNDLWQIESTILALQLDCPKRPTLLAREIEIHAWFTN